MWDAAVASFHDLTGRSVVGWAGTEWALVPDDDDGRAPVFEHPDVPFAQLLELDLVLADGARRSVTTYQDDTAWGLHVRAATDPRPRGGGTRPWTPDLPLGRIDAVDPWEDDDVLAEVVLTVGGRPVLLVAGEAEPTWAGGFEFVRHDESVLVFADPATAERISWRPPRPSRWRSGP